MNTELQNKAWSVLPKEFKEEVKKYFAHYRCALNTHEAIINHIFGLHNLTSDEEGEELLYVSRKEVQKMYAHYDKISNDPNRPKDYIESVYEYADGVTMALDELFGSKCLPDEVVVAENTTASESKPTEPKKESRNLSQNIVDCDKIVDNILKDSFRSERRLNIATSIAAGWLACHGMTNPETIARDALAVTDALIAECELTEKLKGE